MKRTIYIIERHLRPWWQNKIPLLRITYFVFGIVGIILSPLFALFSEYTIWGSVIDGARLIRDSFAKYEHEKKSWKEEYMDKMFPNAKTKGE